MIQAGSLCGGPRWGCSGDTWPSQPETLGQVAPRQQTQTVMGEARAFFFSCGAFGELGSTLIKVPALLCPVSSPGVTFHSGKVILARITDRAGLGCPGNAGASLSHMAFLRPKAWSGVILVYSSLREHQDICGGGWAICHPSSMGLALWRGRVCVLVSLMGSFRGWLGLSRWISACLASSAPSLLLCPPLRLRPPSLLSQGFPQAEPTA